MSGLDIKHESRLIALAQAMVDQERARPIVSPQRDASGFWFGGGNMIEGADGRLYVVGRYRNAGDSRTGLGAGERGLELAVFASDDGGASFGEKVLSFAKADLNVGGREVLSIEGSALRRTPDGGVELFVSTEKTNIGYPEPFEDYLKPGAGVWTIERLAANSVEGLADAEPETVLANSDPEHLHVKDPLVYDHPSGGLMLFFCTHPYCWSSSNTACAVRPSGRTDFTEAGFNFFPRGTTWDVAMTRTTAVMDVPKVGAFEDKDVTLLFYDGGECLRNHEQHGKAVQRPRGYSCEEIGGAAYVLDRDFSRIHRLSRYMPLFTSPHGTGCSRYVDVLGTDAGFHVTWQQSQQDLSQPLVANFLPREQVESLLS
jgi:hypothetical protein